MKRILTTTSLLLLVLLLIQSQAFASTGTSSTSTINTSNQPVIEKGTVINIDSGSHLNIHTQPSTSGTVIGGLSNGDQVDIYSDDGTWLKIIYNNQWGYISKQYVSITSTSGSTGDTSGTSGSTTGSTDGTSGTSGSTSTGSTTVQPGTPKSYTNPVKVEIDRATDSMVTIDQNSGHYELYDDDNHMAIPFNGSLTFTNEANDVSVQLSNGQIYRSNTGFELRELSDSNNGYLTIHKPSNSYTYQYRGSIEIGSGSSVLYLYNTLDMANYLKGVVPSEMPSSWPIEALKSQAVAARNFAYVSMLNAHLLYDDSRSQVYHGMNAEVASTNAAVKDTQGIIATYNGQPISAYFHSSSGGHTANSEDVWHASLPYIRGVDDPYDLNPKNPHANWKKTISNDTMAQQFGLTSGHVLSVNILKKDESGRAQQVEVTSFNTQTNQLSTITLPDGNSSADSLRSSFGETLQSTLFNVTHPDVSVKVKTADGSTTTVDHLLGAKIQLADGTIQPIDTTQLTVEDVNNVFYQPTYPLSFEFDGKGWGHGLGMSQWGAYGMASQGFKYDQILKHYYTGIALQQMK